MNKDDVRSPWPAPWPVEAIIGRLLEGQALYGLVRRKQKKDSRDPREYILENIAREALLQEIGSQPAPRNTEIGTILELGHRRFPASAKPDVVVDYGGQVHVLEVKSSRVEYNRFDNEFDNNQPFTEYLEMVGDGRNTPWEVEQDLIKLLLFKDLSPRVGSCLFLMVDAYKGLGRSWTRVFTSQQRFVDTMRTNLIKQQAHQLLAATHIERLSAQNARARLITCTVHP